MNPISNDGNAYFHECDIDFIDSDIINVDCYADLC